MDPAETMAERHARQLARVAELSLALAEDAQAAALATPEATDKATLCVAFQRMARSVRQSIALEARLVRDQTRDAREAEAHAAAETGAAVETRKRQVRADLERQVVCEIDPREAEAWLADLDERLEEEALYDGFLDEPVEAHIARLTADLGLTGEVVRNYIPRACRPRSGPPVALSRDYQAIYDELLGRCEDDEEEEADEPDDDEVEASPASPAGGGGPPEGGWRGSATAETSPASPLHHPEDGPPPPTEEERPPPEPEPEPPPPEPGPPDPPPYIPPWERLRPGQSWPAGGSGY